MSQTTDILAMLQAGPITALDALEKVGCFRLAARINDLRRDGHNITTNTITLGNGKSIAQYQLTFKGETNGQ
jgi:hypothetical protein